MAFSHWPIRLLEPKLSVSPETKNCDRMVNQVEGDIKRGDKYQEAATVPSPASQDPTGEAPRRFDVRDVSVFLCL